MKKILFLYLILIFAMPVSASNTTISIQDLTAGIGETRSVSLEITDAQDIGSLDITIIYDQSILKAEEVVKSELTEKSMFDYNIGDGKVKIAIVDAEGIGGSGEIAEVSFKVLKVGKSSLDIQATANNARDYTNVELEVHNGEFSSKSAGKPEETPGFTFIAAIGVIAVVSLVMSIDRGRKKSQ